MDIMNFGESQSRSLCIRYYTIITDPGASSERNIRSYSLAISFNAPAAVELASALLGKRMSS